MSTKIVSTLLQELGKREIYATHPHDTVRHLAHSLTNLKIGAMVVLDTDNRLMGIVSERDIVTKVVHMGRKEALVKDIMSKNVISVTPLTNLKECEDLMKEYSIRHLPVVDNGRVLAVISIRDLLVSTRLEQEQLVEHYKNYIMPK